MRRATYGSLTPITGVLRSRGNVNHSPFPLSAKGRGSAPIVDAIADRDDKRAEKPVPTFQAATNRPGENGSRIDWRPRVTKCAMASPTAGRS